MLCVVIKVHVQFLTILI
uniref:Uncharacterized protein n=1 Tax=Anguilla anguilla TaxID=7936 RepID=A0A0E9RXK8_ANGAN